MTEHPAKTKPKWLRKMERESWQPELIISGAAILGSLQLPGLLEQFEYYCLLNFDRDTLFICYIAVIYWRIVATGLIFTFIFHFIVRALWIGLIGLNSVYPGGFRTNQKFSEHYQQRMREEFGDIDGFINRLDRLGSGIFGFAFGIAGVFVNFGLVGVVFIFVHSWIIGYGLDPRQTLFAIGCLLSPLLIISVLTMISHTKRFRDLPFVKRFQWPASMLVSRFTYPLARRYITTSTNLVTSYYADSKAFLAYFIGGMLIMIVFGMATMLSQDNVPFFIDQVYHRMAEDSTRVDNVFAEEEVYDGIYYRPVIDEPRSESDRGLTFWVPLPERETVFMYGNCPIAESNADGQERRAANRQRMLSCARDYLTISVNGVVVSDYQLKRQYRTNAAGDQLGVLAYVPKPNWRTGENLLEVVTQYPHEESGEPRRGYVPFYR